MQKAPKTGACKFHYGTKEVMARIVLLDKDRLLPGEDAFVRIIFEYCGLCL